MTGRPLLVRQAGGCGHRAAPRRVLAAAWSRRRERRRAGGSESPVTRSRGVTGRERGWSRRVASKKRHFLIPKGKKSGIPRPCQQPPQRRGVVVTSARHGVIGRVGARSAAAWQGGSFVAGSAVTGGAAGARSPSHQGPGGTAPRAP